MKKNIFFKVYIILLFTFISIPAYSDKIRNLTTIQQSIQENKLIGYGLVVGLNGSGDETKQSPLTNQSLFGMLSRLGISISSNSKINPKNTASVMVTATLPKFSYVGQKMNVHVSSIGTAQSLEGGILIMTPLRASNNKIYATAQGHVLIEEAKSKKNNFFYFQFPNPHSNVGKIILGATVKKTMNNKIETNGLIYLQLNKEDFSTSQIISNYINKKFNNIATPIDARTIKIALPKNQNKKIKMICEIQNINVFLPKKGEKIIINSKTGTVVSNGNIKINSCNISHKKISILINQKIIKNYENNINSFIKNKNYSINKENKFNSYNSNLINIIRALQSLGTKPEELIFILKSMKNAGCITAKLEII
ncbi:Flagellar P-ring protein [Buchnera aphidicola (Tetraneura ulmi)]|uniref:flagellar basal body P-ring protein FlgI n=1 Tax=Buchnera aphidicola TaxID=9 RepID=UPI0034642B73